MPPAATTGNGGPPPAVLRGVDRAAFSVAFGVRLRRVGVAVGFADLETFARALTVSPPRDRTQLYWLARVCLVRRHDDQAVFDALFEAVFGATVLALDPVARRGRITPVDDDDRFVPLPAAVGEDLDGGGLPWATLPRVVGTGHENEAEVAVPERLPSHLEGLADTPFDALDERDLALLEDWLDSALLEWPRRRSRRLTPAAGGHRIALRPTLARARRTGWEPVELVRTRCLVKPRRLVMLADVSQSMQAHATAYLHLMRAVTVSTDSEVFAFATTLTRLTRVLDHRSPEVAIEAATAKVVDRFGGTRIAGNLRALLSSPHGNAVRGAIVIIASDGWDSDPPAQLALAMARLRRRAHRVIWINPRVAAPGFEPLVASMAAALPFCDDLLPANTLRALADVVAAVGGGLSSRA